MVLDAWPTFKGNGMAFDVDGSLLVCEQMSSCLVRIRLDGMRELVAWHLDGVYLNSPNDVVVRPETAASTSPTPTTGAGTTGSVASASSFAMSRACTACRRAAAVELVVAPASSSSPTGCASPPTSAPLHQRLPAGRDQGVRRSRRWVLTNMRLLRGAIGKGEMSEGNLDGMECDALRQHLDVGAWRRVGVDPHGERIGRIATPEICGSVVFGGPDNTRCS